MSKKTNPDDAATRFQGENMSRYLHDFIKVICIYYDKSNFSYKKSSLTIINSFYIMELSKSDLLVVDGVEKKCYNLRLSDGSIILCISDQIDNFMADL